MSTVGVALADDVPEEVGRETRERVDAFISYSHGDAEFAERLSAGLAAAGKHVFLDQSDIPAAARWEDELKLAIERADSLVFLISPDSIASSECQKELALAGELNKRILPVHARTTPIADLPPVLSARQLIPARGLFDDSEDPARFEQSLQALLTAMDTDLEWVHEHTDWGAKALEWRTHDRDRSFLLSGSELDAAENWLARQSGKAPAPTTLQNEYVLASRRATTSRLRRTRSAVSIALSIAIALTVLALIERATAVSNQKQAQSRQLAASASGVADPEVSALLTLRALSLHYTTQAESALRAAVPGMQALKTLTTSALNRDIEFSPDGQLVVTASADGTARVWSVATGKPTGAVIHAPGGDVASAVFSPDGRTILTAGTDRAARLWSTATGRPTGVVIRPPEFFSGTLRVPLGGAAFSPDGREIVTCGEKGVYLWSAATGQRAGPVYGFPTRGPLSCLGGTAQFGFSPDGRSIFALMSGWTVYIWDARSARLQRTIADRDGGTISSVAYLHNGRSLLTADSSGRVQLWDAASGRRIGVVINDYGSIVDNVAISANGQLIATSRTDGTTNIWSTRTDAIVTRLLGLGNGARAVFDPQASTFLATAGTDTFARLWDALPRDLTQVEWLGGNPTLSEARLSHDGRSLLALTQAGVVDLFNTATWQQTATLTPSSGTRFDWAAFSPNDQLILTAGTDGYARTWYAGTGQPTGQVISPPLPTGLVGLSYGVDPMTHAEFSPDGSRVLTTTARTVAVWRAPGSVGPAPNPLLTMDSPGGYFTGAVFSADGRLILTSAYDGARVWSSSTGRPTSAVMSLTTESFKDASFSPDGRLVLAVGTLRGDAVVFNATTGQPTGTDISLGSGTFNAAAFSPDGQRIVTAGRDGSVRIWTPAGKLLSSFATQGIVYDASFARAGKHVVAGGAGGALTVWDTQLASPLQQVVRIAKSRLTRQLTPYERAKYLAGIG